MSKDTCQSCKWWKHWQDHPPKHHGHGYCQSPDMDNIWMKDTFTAGIFGCIFHEITDEAYEDAYERAAEEFYE